MSEAASDAGGKAGHALKPEKVRKGDAKRALQYARRYARRYMNSPYASQFADIFVALAIEQKQALPPPEIKAVLSLIERKRQREIYLRLGRRAAIEGEVEFPTGHYHGITVTLDPALAPDCLSCILQDVDVRPSVLAEKFFADSECFVSRSSARVEHIFSELYAVPAGIRRGYFKVKVLELLLFLSALDVAHEKHGYTAAQVRLARAARDALLASTEDDVTISALAQELGASPSQLAASFRGVYGMTPAAFLRAQKMHSAAQLLRTSDRTVLDIAGQFGYDNASKFAKAFRSVIGVSPSAYRAGADSDSCAPTAEKAE